MKPKVKSPPLGSYAVGDIARTTEDHPLPGVEGRVSSVDNIEFADGYRLCPRVELPDGSFVYITRPEFGERLR